MKGCTVPQAMRGRHRSPARCPIDTAPIRAAAILALAAAVQVGCANDDANLWNRRYKPPSAASATASDVTGYWEGQVAMGGIRTKIEPSRIVIAIKCDKDAHVVSQGTAPIVVTSGESAKIILQEDLLSTGKDNDVCGFRFYKGNEFKYRMADRDILELGFAGTAMARLTKLADLERPQ